MSNPLIVSATPAADATDVVLGTTIQIVFDQVIDPTTLTDQTFALTGPGQDTLMSGPLMTENRPTLTPGREYITGTFSFSTNASNQTIATFTPSRPLWPGTQYIILILGTAGSLIAAAVANPGGEQMVNSYQYSFTTGTLDLKTPPIQCPLPTQHRRINPAHIIVRPKATLDNDLTKQIELIFPGEIDTNSFDPTKIEVGVEAILGDLGVRVPRGLESSIAVDNDTITVVISGWPAGSTGFGGI